MSDTSATMYDQANDYISERYGVQPEHLWQEYPEYDVFRHPSRDGKGKWFAFLANAMYEQIGEKANNPNEETFVAVVKVDPELINELSTQPGYARGYHMNKEHWLTVLLDGSVSFTDVCKHIDSSFQLTSD